MIFTLKRIFIFPAFFISAFAVNAQSYNNIEFIENKGQWDSQVQFKGEVSNGAFFIRKGGFTVLQHNPVDFAKLNRLIHGQSINGEGLATANESVVMRSHSYNVDFVGASVTLKTIPDKIVDTYTNYFTGSDPSKWAGGCRIYQGITLKDVYPNIDVRYYTDNEFLKYDIIVKPGGNVSNIALKYVGADNLQVKNKELTIGTSVGELKESSPYTYQYDMDGKKEINCRFVVKDNIVRFDVKNYDPAATLVIDPRIVFCSFASKTSAGSWGFTATYGPDGSMFGGGIVFSSGFPVSPGAFQTTFGGGSPLGIDMGIIKLTPDGKLQSYCTYIGGTGDEQPHSLVVNSQGNLIIAGRSNSPVSGNGSYPLRNNGSLAGGSFDIVVTELNANGTALVGSRRIGGNQEDGVNISASRSPSSLQTNYGDDGRSEVIVDGAGNVYVASCTKSSNFPVTPGVFQGTFGGGNQDAVVLKFTPDLGTLLFASYLGGAANDAAYVLSISSNNDVYVAGGTESRASPLGTGGLPGNTTGTIGTNNHGGIDGFISVINNTGTSVARTTYIGTSGIDQIYGIQFDIKGFPYIAGQTTGSWPITPGTPTYGSSAGKQFIAKLKPDLSAFVYSTVFGTGSLTPNISITAFLVDRCENVYVSGWGGFYDNTNPFGSSGTFGLPITSDAMKNNTDNKDFYFIVLKRDAVSMLYGSFFGEDNSTRGGGDHVDGGTSRFDRNGVIYQAVCANCKLLAPPYPIFPTTTGSYATQNNATSASGCNLAMLKLEMNLAGVAGDVQSSINGVPRDSSGCVPLTVDFSDSIRKALSYEWYFNYVPGNPPDTITIAPNATHTYNIIGSYRVLLVAIDPNSCNIRDSSFITIKVGDLKADLSFGFRKTGDCNSLEYEFDNTSIPPPVKPFTNTSFIWDFGDNTPPVVAGLGPILHTFPNAGPYDVTLRLTDTAYCNAPEDDKVKIEVAANVKAKFSTPSFGCLQYNAVFINQSTGGQTWLWEFGDGTFSTDFEPVHLYNVARTYRVRLFAYNPNTCNKTDSTDYFTITVLDAPTPDFDFSPKPPLENTPTIFTNLSSPDAIRFKWQFGDGDSLLTASRQPVQHQYNATGTFNACLTAYNAAGCDSTKCRPVSAVILPLLDVPNAFTPLSGDENSIVLVRGFGIAKMQFIIWNRWGQKVFETNNRFQGWNGKVKGVVQPMDVYAYTLSVEYSDGTKTTKKGDITLIR